MRPSGTYRVAFHQASGTTAAAVIGPVPGRITWTLPLPRQAWFRAQIAATGGDARVRLGVSDARVYEQVAEQVVTPETGWAWLNADLSEYAGMKFSLFYHPDREAWRVNLSIDPFPGPATVAIAAPQIAAPQRDAAEYVHRRARFVRPYS